MTNKILGTLIVLAGVYGAQSASAQSALPAACSTSMIQYRGNFHINTIEADINRATAYRARLGSTLEDKENLLRIDSQIRTYAKQYASQINLQIDCMRLNPVYSASEAASESHINYKMVLSWFAPNVKP